MQEINTMTLQMTLAFGAALGILSVLGMLGLS